MHFRGKQTNRVHNGSDLKAAAPIKPWITPILNLIGKFHPILHYFHSNFESKQMEPQITPILNLIEKFHQNLLIWIFYLIELFHSNFELKQMETSDYSNSSIY